MTTSDPTSRQISLYCDGELSPEEARRIEGQIAQRPELKARVEFQRKLRQRLATVLLAPATAPADLAQRIRERLAADGAAPPLVQVVRPQRPQRPWWRESQRANLFAVA